MKITRVKMMDKGLKGLRSGMRKVKTVAELPSERVPCKGARSGGAVRSEGHFML